MADEVDDTHNAAAVTRAVTAAFALGWQMARLYSGPRSSDQGSKPPVDLPGLSALTSESLIALGLGQVDAGLAVLTDFLGEQVALPTTNATRTVIADGTASADAVRNAILDLHVQILTRLTAADYRLGKAYGLGRALADTCSPAEGDDDQRRKLLAHHLEPHRALVLVGWLNDLTSVLPLHAGKAVEGSLLAWTSWGEAANIGGMLPETVNSSTRALHSNGQRWRAIISGEKDARELLTSDDYVTTSRGFLERVGSIGRSLAWRLKCPLTVTLALIVLGLVLIFRDRSTAQVLAGLGTVAGGLSVTWRSAAAALAHVSLNVAKPLWTAELDVVIAGRLTQLPHHDCAGKSQLWPRPKKSKSPSSTSVDCNETHDPEVSGYRDTPPDSAQEFPDS